ncbi:MAG TPA: hypothetical protein VKR06_20120 [Ktedonosporobacter sp.]|nr:hypothetical protein [Ktedonosporobacter sp.]
MDPQLIQQITPYEPWLTIIGVLVLFILLRITRKTLRRRVDQIGYQLMRERGMLIWFWLNAPGVMVHELSHALVVLLLRPFGFRITSITLFSIKPMVARGPNGRIMRSGGRQWLQLGEVQYDRPVGRPITYIGDGISGIAPLFGGTAMFILLYWVATGYNLWDATEHLQILRPGWPWWTLLFAPYLILTVTSELWPSRKDWEGAFWFVIGMVLLIGAIITALWYFHQLNAMFSIATLVAQHVDFALLILLALDLIFLAIAELLAHTFWR